MRRVNALVRIATVSALVAAALAADASTDRSPHLACHTDPVSGAVYTIYVSSSVGTKFTKNVGGQEQSDSSNILYGPNPAAWPDGVQLATRLQDRGLFPGSTTAVTSATWTRDDATRVDVMTFTAADNSSVAFNSSTCANWLNCQSWGGYSGKHCWAETETCCGDGSMNPTCIDNASGDKCCAWHKAAAPCNATQTCCGQFGPGASSGAFCCDAGATCCNARGGASGAAACCPANTKCCAASTVGLCCAMNEECDAENNRCVPASTTAAPAPVVVVDLPAVPPVPVVITLIGAFDRLVNNQAVRAALEFALRKDMANALHVAVDRVHIESIQCGSDRTTLVRFMVDALSAENAQALTATAASLRSAGATLPETAKVYAANTRDVNDAASSDGGSISWASSATNPFMGCLLAVCVCATVLVSAL